MLNAPEINAAGQISEPKEPGKGGRKADGSSPETTAAAFMELFSGTMARAISVGNLDEGGVNAAPVENRPVRETPKSSESEPKAEAAADRKAPAGETSEKNDKAARAAEADERAQDRQMAADESEAEGKQIKTNRNRRTPENDKAGDGRKAAKVAAQAAGKGLARLSAEGKAVAAETAAESAKEIKDVAAQTAPRQSARAVAAQADSATVAANTRKTTAVETASFKDEMPKVSVNKTVVSAETQKTPVAETANTQQNQGQSQGDGSRADSAAQNAELAAANAPAKAASGNKGFSVFLEGAKGSKQAAAARVNGSQVSLNVASSNYTRAAADVINTGKAKAATPAPPAQVLTQIIRAAKVSLQSGKEEMKLLLKPEDLGWLKVKISIEGHKVTAHFSAENEFVRGLLENNISHLQQALQGQNLKVSQIVIDVNAQLQQDTGAAKDQQRHASQKQARAEQDGEAIDDMVMIPDMQSIRMTALDYCV